MFKFILNICHCALDTINKLGNLNHISFDFFFFFNIMYFKFLAGKISTAKFSHKNDIGALSSTYREQTKQATNESGLK